MSPSRTRLKPLKWATYSSSLALTLMVSSVAKAQTAPLREVVFSAPAVNATASTSIPVNCTCTRLTGEPAPEQPAGGLEDLGYDGSDAEGNLAIDLFGCDCAGCRRSVQQMAQSGLITLPES